MRPRRNVAVYDERRNTSRVMPVSPQALPDALRALGAFRRDAPEHAAWIAAGYPTLTEAEHVRRFGEPYQKHATRRKEHHGNRAA